MKMEGGQRMGICGSALYNVSNDLMQHAQKYDGGHVDCTKRTNQNEGWKERKYALKSCISCC